MEIVIACPNFELLRKLLSPFKRADFLQIECFPARLCLYGELTSGLVASFEMSSPLIAIETKFDERLHVLFSGPPFLNAIKKFAKSALSQCDMVMLHISESKLVCKGTKDGQDRSEISIAAVGDTGGLSFEYNSIDLSRDMGFAFAYQLSMDSLPFLHGLISLHDKELTRLVVEKGKMLFECKDDSGVATQKQYVPLPPSSSSFLFDHNIAHSGIEALKIFLTTCTGLYGTKQPAKQESKEPKKKKPKKEDEPMNQIPILIKLDPERPIIVSCQLLGVKAKLMVCTQVEAID
jgi:hypothetical protein